MGLFGVAAVEQVAAVALAAHLAGQRFQVGPPDAALVGKGVGGEFEGGGMEMNAVGQRHRVGVAGEAQQLVFEATQVGVADLGQGTVLGLDPQITAQIIPDEV